MSKGFNCAYCRTSHPDRGEALRCCSDLPDLATDQVPIENWSAAGFRRASELEEVTDGGC